MRKKEKKANGKWYYFWCEREKRRKWTCSTCTQSFILMKAAYKIFLFFFFFCFFFLASVSREIQMFQPFHSHYFTKYVYLYIFTSVHAPDSHAQTPTHVVWQRYLIAHHNSGNSVEWCRTPLFNIHRSLFLWAIRTHKTHAHERAYILYNHSIYTGI